MTVDSDVKRVRARRHEVLSGRCYDVQNREDNIFSTDVSAQKHTFRYERQHDAMIEITLLTVSQFFISLDEFRQTIA